VAFQLITDIDNIESQVYRLVDSSARALVLDLLKTVRLLTQIVDGQASAINQLRAQRTIVK
jgi:hypothetical protein